MTALCRPNGSYVIADHNALKPEVVEGPVVTEVRSTYSTWAQLTTRCADIKTSVSTATLNLLCTGVCHVPVFCHL